MIRAWKTAYNAGWRAGACAIPHFVPLPDGLKYIASGEELCPIPRRHWLRRFAWLQGYESGLHYRLSQPILKGF